MGRASKARTRDVYDDERRGMRPGAAALFVVAVGFGTAIVWNAFFGSHQPRSMESLLAEIPAGATTSVVVNAPAKPQAKTITIKYDSDVEDIQRELLATGHYRGLVDGVMGNRTLIAIKQYQKDNGLAADGQATKALIEHIRFTRKVAQASEQTGSLPQKASAPPPKKTNDAADARLRILDVQLRLSRLGYDTGENDGTFGDGTRAAILQFELDHGLDMEGRIGKAFLAALKKAEQNRSASAQ
jgi:peptidoglycan hydrolase-like protein with peptidoglycan-binding domain